MITTIHARQIVNQKNSLVPYRSNLPLQAREINVEFQGAPLNGRKDTADNVFCSSTKCPSL